MLTIREAVSSDLEELLELYEHFHRRDNSPRQGVERAWEQMLAHPGLHVYIGEAGGRFATSCTLVVVPNLRSGPRPYGLLETVVTHGGHRRRGYGTAIVRHALARAWEMDCYRVMLLTGRPEGVQKFYEQAGLTPGKAGFVATRPPEPVTER